MTHFGGKGEIAYDKIGKNLKFSCVRAKKAQQFKYFRIHPLYVVLWICQWISLKYNILSILSEIASILWKNIQIKYCKLIFHY